VTSDVDFDPSPAPLAFPEPTFMFANCDVIDLTELSIKFDARTNISASPANDVPI